MKPGKISRRRLLAAAFLSAPALVVADALWLEPAWLKIRRIRLGCEKPTHRLIHFTDLHYRGTRANLDAVVRKVNELSPDFVCFTGDLIEGNAYVPEGLDILAGIKSPLYGVPGNHDYWCKLPFDSLAKTFGATGGAWLQDEQAITRDGKFSIFGATCLSSRRQLIRSNPATRNILLMHYPAWVKKLHNEKFDLILAGHSHGGQVRFPFYGPVYVPFGVDEYDKGLFQTTCGPLYVNPGLGWFPWSIRFNCRPELTVIEL